MPKIMSLFDGSGGFPLAASLCGITPTYASEVEPYPIAVTRSRFPDMVHLGSVTDVHGDKVDPVDVVTFGSPCQDLSVAGKRAGLKHEGKGDDETTRSGLFMEAVRIIKEMREATNGLYPAFAVWENVPGAFSSNKGEDFRTVLEELIRIIEPTAVMPSVPKAGWAYADVYCGDGWSLAYRVLDAQYWGVPQRRRRIYLVLDLRGERAGEVLSEREGLRGYSAESFRAWQRAARGTENCTGIAGFGLDGYNGTVSPVASTLGVNCGMSTGRNGVVLNDQGGNRMDVTHEVTCTLRAEAHHPPVVLDDPAVFENHSQDTRYTGPVDVAPTVSHQYGTGGNNQPFVVSEIAALAFGISSKDSNGMKSANPYVGFYEAETVRTLDGNGGNPTCNQGGTAVAKGPGAVQRGYTVRRLTPTECARLQGFPDQRGHPDRKDNFSDDEYAFWLNVRNTHATINGKATREYTKDQMLRWYNGLHTDSAEYKLWGNGLALPCALYVMEGIAKCLSTEK